MALIIPEYLWTKKYSAKRDRLALQHGGAVQAGVWDANDFKVVQRAAGANMSVDVGAGFALVPANSAGNLGLYHIQNDGTVNVAVTASHASLPRIDQVFVEVNDSTDGGDGSDTPVFNIVAGTPTSGATLDNRTGAGAVPNNALRVADILVPAASSTVTTANIRDRRPWARGGYLRVIRGAGGTDYTRTSATMGVIDATVFNRRMECSGVPLLLALRGTTSHSVAGGAIFFTHRMDGADLESPSYVGHDINVATATKSQPVQFHYDAIPPAGSHLFAPYWATGSATATLYSSTLGGTLEFVIMESIRQNAENS